MTLKPIPVPDYIADHVRRTKALRDAEPDKAPDSVLIDPSARAGLRGFEWVQARGFGD